MNKLYLFVIIIIISNNTFSQNKEIDSLKDLIFNAKNDTILIDHYICISDIYKSIDPHKGIEYADSAYDLSIKINYRNGLCGSLVTKALCYANLGNLNKADSLNNVSISIAKSINDYSCLARANNNLGVIKTHLGKYQEAIEYNLEAKKYYSKIGDKSLVAGTLSNIGIIYYYQKNLEKAIEYHLESLKMIDPDDYEKTRNRAIIMRNIGAFYYELENIDSALYYTKKALDLQIVIGDKKGIATSYNNLADIVLKKNDTIACEKYFLKSIKIKKEIGDKKGLNYSYRNLGELYFEQGKYEKALKLINKALDLSLETGEKHTIIKNYLQLAKFYEKTNNYKKAYKHHNLYHEYYDSLQTEKSKTTLLEMQTKFETEKKTKEIELLKRQEKIQKLEIRRKNIQKNWLITGFVFMIILVYVIYRSYRQKQKANIIITEKNQKLEHANEEILAQKDEIEKHNKNMHDSIVYAKQIQNAVLPDKTFFSNYFDEFFLLYKPKDVVSGDFYWIGEVENKIFVAIADCTGHGVPGAFMSMLGITFFNKIIIEKKISDTVEIMERLRTNIISSLSQKGYEEEARDGMEIALCIIDKSTKTIEFSGSNQNLLIFNNSGLNEIKGDKMPVGIYIKMDIFHKKQLHYNNGDVIYLFTDGYIDQFKENDDKRFSKKQFKELLTDIQMLSLNKQKDKLEQTLIEWQGKSEQIDDISILGIKL
ncbi:MAG: tetratricopeptide repeat protein [Bacteroidales bacterium]|nr:tetratricopeptide repeat protein [Bacteroidales bacterium]